MKYIDKLIAEGGQKFMKRTYETPVAYVEEFMPNEYVSACVTGTIQCAIPGRSAYAVNDGTSSRTNNWQLYNSWNWDWPGDHLSADGMPHGICGEATSITFSDSDGSGSGYEMNHGVLDTSRPIYNIRGYNLATGTYNVYWQSNNGSEEYNHYGTLTISNIDNSRPNHS